ncbi:MAG TPA: GGDEF domain-containing protein [Acidimicrobiales bacterium]|nr:GGDEF domain-containing protein [Acidimicrobiales bacterium]
MDPTKHDALADAIGGDAEGDADARRRFWLTHMLLGFGVFLMETLVVMLYLALTPHGPHRLLLWWITASWLAGAAAGLALAPVVASRPWRSAYSVAWTIAATYAVGLVALLDHGVVSPILLLLYLPLVYGALMFTPRSAALCGASALVSLAIVAVVDRDVTAAGGRTFMLFTTLAGAAVLSVTAAINRSHVERHEASLTATLAELASTDELTGCATRRVLRQHTEQEIERALRSGSPLSLLMVDVDRFKDVNDRFGHLVGDRVLAAVGRILLANVRTFDVACRLGGDEFALLLPETDASGAAHVAERIFRDLAVAAEAPVTLSIGVSTLDRSRATAEHLFDEADLALYQAKRAGRDAIAVRAPEVPAPITW